MVKNAVFTWDYQPYANWWGNDSKLKLNFNKADNLNQNWSDLKV